MTPTPRPWGSSDVASTTTTTMLRRGGGPHRGVVTFAAEADRNEKDGEDGGTSLQWWNEHRQRSTPRPKGRPHPHQEESTDRRRRPSSWFDAAAAAAAAAAARTPGEAASFLDDTTDPDAILTPRTAVAASASRRRTPRAIMSSSFSSSAPFSTSKLWHDETIDDEDEEEQLLRLWDEPRVVAEYVQGQLRRVQDNLLLRWGRDDGLVQDHSDGAVNNTNHSAEGFRRYVELLRSLQAIQAQQVGALLDRAPPGKEDVAATELGTSKEAEVAPGDDAGRHPPPRGDVRRPPPPSLFHHHAPSQMEESTARPREGTQEDDDKEDEKKEEEDRQGEALHARRGLDAEFSHPSRRGMDAMDATKAATESTNVATPTEDSLAAEAAAEPSLVSEWQQQQQPQQGSASRFGFVRLSTLEEVEYESDRTTPSAAASAAAATPTMKTTTTPATKTPPSSSSLTLRRSSAPYVEAPSDEMDSQMWEHESNRTLDTHDDDDYDTFERLHGTSGTSPAPSRAPRRGAAGAGRRTSEGQGEDDDDYDEGEYDSALDCATLIASHRERRTSRTVLGPSSPPGEDEPRHSPSAAAAATAVHATPSSAFPNKVVVVDYSENQPSPTMTNITMDEDMFDAVEKVENDDDGMDVRTQSNNKQKVQDVNDSFPGANLDQHQSFSGREDDDDNATTTSQETPVLERYRIDLDDESPHGFTVIPNPRRSRRGTKLSGGTPVDTDKESSARPPSQQPTAVTLLEKASMAFTSEEFQAAENDWLASPNVSHSGRRRSVRKALRKSPYKLPKMVPTTPTIDENAPLALPGDVGGSSSAERNRHRDESSVFLESGRLRASLGGSGDAPRSLVASPATRLYNATKEPLVKFKSTPSTPGSGASTLLYANAQLVLREAKQLNQSHRSFDYSDLRGEEATPREGNGQAAAVVIPALTEAEYNSSRCIARSGITLEEAQRAIAALNLALRDRAAVAATPPSRARPGPTVGSGDRSVLRSSPYLKNRRDAAGAAASLSPALASPRPHFREHEAKRILMQALNITDRKSKTILVGLCHWRRLVLRRQSFGGGGGSSLGGVGVGGTRSPGWGGVGGNNNDDDNASTSSSTTLSLLLYEVPAAKPREAVSLI